MSSHSINLTVETALGFLDSKHSQTLKEITQLYQLSQFIIHLEISKQCISINKYASLIYQFE